MEMNDQFEWWKNALQGERGVIHADEPMSGYYRTKAKNGTLSAIAYWIDSQTGILRCQQNGRDVDDLPAREMWPFASRHPISEATFWTFRDTGVWPDIDGAEQKSAEVYAETSPHLAISLEISAAMEAVSKYRKIESDEEMALAQSLRAKLLDLRASAEKQGKALYGPLYEQYKEIYDVWNPLVKAADNAALKIRTAMADWNDFKLAQAAKAQMSDVAPNAPPPSVQVAGGGGRAAAVRVKDIVTAIDEDKVFQQFKGNVDLTDILMRLAQRAVDAGTPVPGATVEKKSSIR
jgi:hypothetical protein